MSKAEDGGPVDRDVRRLVKQLRDYAHDDGDIFERAADELERLRAENERLRRALHDIAEEWAGAECGEPVHAQEAYAIGLAKRMYALAVEGLKSNAVVTGSGAEQMGGRGNGPLSGLPRS